MCEYINVNPDFLQVQYLNDYHSKCYEALKDHLQGPQNIQALHWLKKETQPIGKGIE